MQSDADRPNLGHLESWRSVRGGRCAPPSLCRGCGPRDASIRLLKSPDVFPFALGLYVQDSIRPNLPKQAGGSLPGAASAFRFYTAFCEPRKAGPFPAHGEVVASE